MENNLFSAYDLICFSHLRWNFVYQRPQHLLTRFAGNSRVFYFEEPVFDAAENNFEIIKDPQHNVHIIVPHLRQNLKESEIDQARKTILDDVIANFKITRIISWYYSPMFYDFSSHLNPILIVYDCMDELSAFKFAPDSLKEKEIWLMKNADLVFTGGVTLYEAKKNQHSNIHPFPSSIDKPHFMSARAGSREPADQEHIPQPKLGYYGVIDERINLALINEMAEKKPDWNFIYIGPIVKIDAESLPRKSNIYYFGSRNYQDLPLYMSGWNICLMPFALNESTRFISPTKTPEYLAAAKPVISTPIADVVKPYGESGLVHIASTADEFISAAEYELGNTNRDTWLGNVDHHLSFISWDRTWKKMRELMEEVIREKNNHQIKNDEAYV
jgi:UDP-galactopyranose mutase